MPSDSSTSDHRRTTTTKTHHAALGAPPSEAEHLPCPRCDSINTKFCYYNNYNFSQPRHFCKSCRRYWTHGGTLRDIPIGGGSRKNAKRSRVSLATSRNTSPVSEYRRIIPSAAASVLMPFAGAPPCGSFTSLLSNTTHHGSAGIFGFDQDLSFGVGRTMWAFSGIGDGGGVSCQAAVGGGGSTWQLESGEGDEDCFVLPDLAISTPGINAMK